MEKSQCCGQNGGSMPSEGGRAAQLDDRKHQLMEALAKADGETVREILRQSECYLEAQLAAGLAADQRATTFASILAGSLTVIIGGVATIVLGESRYQVILLPALPMVICFAVSLWLSAEAAKPVDFYYRGNVPMGWLDDIQRKKELEISLAEQAFHYDEMIADNAKSLQFSAGRFNDALRIAQLGIVLGAAVVLLLTFVMVSERQVNPL
jgi:hypothetical protein